MPKSFYIGLSWMSSGGGPSERRKHSAEGRRILALLDALPSALPLEPKEAVLKRPITYEAGGRPYFEPSGQPHADFSISHSRNMVAAALLSAAPEGVGGVLPGRIGCDIQCCNPGKSFVEISRRFFQACEQAYIEEDPAAQLQRFYQVWVLKEAWLKMHGLSVFDMPKAPAFCIGGVQTGTVENASDTDFFLYELSSPVSGFEPTGGAMYTLAAACQRIHSGGESEPEIRWFSDLALALKRVENIYAAQSPVNTVTPKM
ncbi:MAG: 4'-phosphopantetheinyl transferase superfamily protein [Treponema sp.]|jgi:phosphopantetheinyl transferase (holo-ACP synthase)|nr:4'-phosphopantetheinyl transferase superfamily protein [Treponema sp.]